MQENKNLVIAVVLCLAILFGWTPFAEYMGWIAPPPPPREPQQPATQPAEPVAPQAPVPTFAPSPGKDFPVDTPLYNAIFYTGGAPLRSFELKDYKAAIQPDSANVNLVDERTAAVAPLGLLVNSQPSWSTGTWGLDGDSASLDVTDTGSFAITGEVDNLRVRREFTFDASTYLIREKVTIANPGAQPRSVRIGFTSAMDSSHASGSRYDSMRVAWDDNGKLVDEDDAGDLAASGVQASGNIYWAGPMSTYFMAAVVPGETRDVTVKGRLQGSVYRVAVEERDVMLEAGARKELNVSYWLGPKDRKGLAAVSDELVRAIDMGFFGWIGKFLIMILEFLHAYVHNWGVAIILLTVLIKIVFWPLADKSYASMERMKQLQPLMLNIKEKCAGNREQMNREVMSLYRTYKINPAMGCLPMLVQLPVFFGLYQALMSSLALRHASFVTHLPGTHVLWLADLSNKDPLYITPIIMGLTMFLQQKMSPPPADPTQQKVMMFLPLIFTVLFLSFPSGLVLYWLVNNVLSIFQQWLIMRRFRHRAPQAVRAAEQHGESGKNAR